MSSFDTRQVSRFLGVFLLGLLPAAALSAQPAQGSGDEIRQTVARISFLTGSVSYVRGDDPDNWQAADFNVPVTIGDRVATGDDGRAELQVHGGFVIRVGAQAALAALNLTDDTKQWSLNAGYAAFQVRSLGENEVFEVDTPNAAVTFERTGEYRVDVDTDGNTRVAVRRGRALVAAGGGQVPLNAGEQMNVDGIDSPRYDIVSAGTPDGFDQWVSERQRRSETSRSRQYVNDSIVGVADLDEHGRWQGIPSYGMGWTPTVVAADWQPYRSGHWIWQDPWGWTWVAAEPWGWAPYHYGRWVNWSSRWWWVPVARSVRVVYAPALVVFSGGGPGWSDGGGGFVGWFPLAPREVFIPWWGSRRGGNAAVGTYANRGFLTVVNHNTFVSGGVVTTSWVRDRSVVASIERAPILRGPLPILPTPSSLRVAARTDLPQAFHPSPAVLSRAVVVRVPPPPPPPSFQAKVVVIQQNRGEPVGAAAAARIVESNRGAGKPAYALRPVAAESGRVTFTPKTENASSPRPEPVAPLRGHPLAAVGAGPSSGVAPTPQVSPARQESGRRTDDKRHPEARPTAVPAHETQPTAVPAHETRPTAVPTPRPQPKQQQQTQSEPPRRQHEGENPPRREAKPTAVPAREAQPTAVPEHEERQRPPAQHPAPESGKPNEAQAKKPAPRPTPKPTPNPS